VERKTGWNLMTEQEQKEKDILEYKYKILIKYVADNILQCTDEDVIEIIDSSYELIKEKELEDYCDKLYNLH
jgi:hypothetical protein